MAIASGHSKQRIFMRRIRTLRLTLIPCTLEMALAAVAGKDKLKIKTSVNWPSKDIKDLLPLYVEQLKADPKVLGWGPWLIAHNADATVIGDIGFTGRPDSKGVVEIGYGIVPEYRKQGFAFEAAQAMVRWAFSQRQVKKVIAARVRRANIPSVRILAKLGMKCLTPKGKLTDWEILKNDFASRIAHTQVNR
jgi:[ribosomal protein S5]-alanine N-acetyltransferase